MNSTLTRLEAALLQLHERLAPVDEPAGSRFSEWVQRWDDQNGHIARGLQLIESQLNGEPKIDSETPQLAVCGGDDTET